MMARYKVMATSHPVIKTDAEGRILEHTEYRRGDEIDLPEGEAARLVRTGGLVPVDDSGSTEPSEATTETLVQRAATVGGSADGEVTSGATGGDGESHTAPGEDLTSDEEASEDSSEDLTGQSEEAGDKYDAMSYADLQQEAKARDLNAGGSADDLRGRLREDDAADESAE